MRSLVTGGAGFIGSHVVRALLAAGDEVRVLHLPGEPLANLRGLEVERMAGDVTRPDECRVAVRGCERVFHLAAIYELWVPDAERMRAVNVDGTRNVLAAAAEAGVRKVVHTSSIAAFGGQGQDGRATEASAFRLEASGDPYVLTKREAHVLARAFASRGLDVTIVAPTAPIGPGDLRPTPTGRLLLAALRGPVALVPDVSANLGDVRDIARGHLLAAERGGRGESYLLGGDDVSMARLARIALAVAGLRRPVGRVPDPLLRAAGAGLLWASRRLTGRPPLLTPAAVATLRLGLRADCSRAFRELGLPRRPLEESVRDALRWFAEHGHIRSRRLRRALIGPSAAPGAAARSGASAASGRASGGSLSA